MRFILGGTLPLRVSRHRQRAMQQLAARSHAAHASPRLNRRARALRSAAGSSGGSNSTDSAASSSCAGDAPRFTPWPQGGLVHVDAEVSPGAEVHAGAVVLAGACVGEVRRLQGAQAVSA